MKRTFALARRVLAGVLPLALLGMLALVGSPLVFAQNQGFINPLKVDNLYDFLLLILNAVIYIMFPVIVLMIVYTGFLFVAAQGNPSKLQEARRALVWTVIGALVVLGAKALALAIQATVANLKA